MTPEPAPHTDHGASEVEPLELPTGTRKVRGPTAFVLGLMLAIAIAAILRTCP